MLVRLMIGKYKKQKLLSETVTGPVWLVRDESSGKDCVIKLMPLSYESKTSQQISVLKNLKNSRIVQYVDAFKDEASNAYAILMEYCPCNVLLFSIRWRFSITN